MFGQPPPQMQRGCTDFSMHPASVLEVKRIIIESNVHALRAQAANLLETGDPQEILGGEGLWLRFRPQERVIFNDEV